VLETGMIIGEIAGYIAPFSPKSAAAQTKAGNRAHAEHDIHSIMDSEQLKLIES
jgi:hypothetical protein